MATIQTFNDWETGSSVRSKINTSLTNLNNDKAETSALAGKQDTLVSWTNIKTINGSTILGSGDLVVSGGWSVATDAIWDAKGDLAVGTGANTASRLAVGANGTIPIADSAEVTGIRWGTPAGGWDVTKVWTPVNNQVGVWTGDGTLEGDAALTFDTATDTLTTGTVNSTSLTASELTATDASKNIISLPVATYPSLTELTYVKGVTSAIQTQINTKSSSASPTFTGSVTVPTPANPTDAANKGYVDSVAQWLDAKPSCIVATTASLPSYVYANWASGVGATITAVATWTVSVDGRTLALNDVILVKDETAGNAPYNGMYTVTVAWAIGVALVLTRHTSMDTTGEFTGAYSFVETGTVNAGAGFVCTNSVDPTVGTTAITFTQFSGAWQIIAWSWLTKTGNTIDIDAWELWTLINWTTSKTTPVDADNIAITDSAASHILKKLTWANLKATLKTYFDSLTTTLTNKTLTAPIITYSINAQTGTTYTLVLTDQSKLVTLTNASAIAVTIPTNASVAFPVWTQIDFSQDWAWKVTFSGAGVTINSLSSLKSIGGQYVGATLVKTATDTWNLYWNLIS